MTRFLINFFYVAIVFLIMTFVENVTTSVVIGSLMLLFFVGLNIKFDIDDEKAERAKK